MARSIAISMLIISLLVLSKCVEISIGQSDPNLAQKKKVYCSMISYHFLDDHDSVIETFTKGMSSFKSELFKNKVAKKLSQNCQQKISTQQILKLSKLVDHPSGHQKQLLEVQNKYVQYFSPEEGIVLKLYEQVKAESDMEVSKQLQKFHKERKSIEENTKIVVEGFKKLENSIGEGGKFMVTTIQLMSSLITDIHNKFLDAIQKVKTSQEIKKIQNFIDDL